MKLTFLLANLLVLSLIVCANPRLAQAEQWEELSPPHDLNGRYNFHAPLPSWEVIKSFSSKGECEENVLGAKQVARQALASDLSDFTPEQKQRLKTNVAVIRATRCVSENDPRLRH